MLCAIFPRIRPCCLIILKTVLKCVGPPKNGITTDSGVVLYVENHSLPRDTQFESGKLISFRMTLHAQGRQR